MKKMVLLLVVSLVAATITAEISTAEEAKREATQEKGWKFSMTPYMWFLSMEGDVTVKGRKSDVDVDFNKIWDEFNIGAMLEFEARKGKLGFYLDTIYANLSNDTTADNIKVEPKINVLWLQFGAFYRLGTWALSNEPGKKLPAVTVDTSVGGRYTYLDIELDFEGLADPKGHRDWVEPTIGGRTLWDLSKRWSLSVGGDVGGFGAGSDFAWQSYGLIGYCVSLLGKKDNAKVFAGYRAMSQDYDDGSGNNRFEWDITLHGPVLGLAIKF